MNGQYIPKESWEKQQVFLLDNGWKATIEFHQTYGEFIKRLDFPKGQAFPNGTSYWITSYGRSTLPKFAKGWVEKHGLVRVRFVKNY